MAVARVTKLTASSIKGFEDAVQTGIKRAAKTVRGMTGLHVQRLSVRGAAAFQIGIPMQ